MIYFPAGKYSFSVQRMKCFRKWSGVHTHYQQFFRCFLLLHSARETGCCRCCAHAEHRGASRSPAAVSPSDTHLSSGCVIPSHRCGMQVAKANLQMRRDPQFSGVESREGCPCRQTAVAACGLGWGAGGAGLGAPGKGPAGGRAVAGAALQSHPLVGMEMGTEGRSVWLLRSFGEGFGWILFTCLRSFLPICDILVGCSRGRDCLRGGENRLKSGIRMLFLPCLSIVFNLSFCPISFA